MRCTIPVLAALILPVCTASPEPAPAPPCSSPAHAAFDFWIGEWEVLAPNGAKAGENSVTRTEAGCLIVEHWVNAAGQTGQSYNFLDPAKNQWRQVWVSAGAVIDLAGGLTASGSMKMEGTITYQSGPPGLPFTGEWTANPDATVTQHFEQFDAATGTWTPWFTGTYVRKPAP